jgi:hypothetical protein
MSLINNKLKPSNDGREANNKYYRKLSSLFRRAKEEVKFLVHFAAETLPKMTLGTLCLHHVVICN